jgi:superfamily II DNA or RNA helicase
MEHLVQKYSNKVRDYNNQKTRKTSLISILKTNFGIERRSDKNMKELSDLFRKYNLVVYSADNKEFDLTKLNQNVYQEVYVRYIPNQTTNIVTISHSDDDIGKKSISKESSGVICVSNEPSKFKLFDHQANAIKELDHYFSNHTQPIKGLLVLPTGSGKTKTAVYWILKNYIDKYKKIIWIAHRHELLNQAKEEFMKLSHKDITSRNEYRFRVVSGLSDHDRTIDIAKDDDVIIASKDSLRHGRDHLLKNFLNYNQDVLLVIDEAHHATARTYTELIKYLEENLKNFNVLGLTATPYRTAEKEAGHLKLVFKDNIIYKDDIKKLITQGILAKMNIIPIETFNCRYIH